MAPRLDPPPDLVDAANDGLSAMLELVVERGGTPVRNEAATTFLYLGQATTVRLRHWMDIFPAVPPFTQIPGTDVWWTSVDLPERARIEYKLEVQRAGRRRLIADPLNPLLARGPYGANSVATGPSYQPSPHASPRPEVAAGRVADLPVVSRVFGETRTCRLYLPAGYDGEPIALVVAHDGSEYLDYAALGTVLDNVNTTGRVAALMVDPDDRLVEYGADPHHAEHLVYEAIPAARHRVDAIRIIALGASFGGVASLHAAWRYPGTFSGLVLQSGSFVEATGGPFRRGKPFAPVVQFMRELWEDPGDLPGHMHLSCGQFDGLIGDNRRMVDRLGDIGIEVGWEEVAGGHHWGLWQDLLGAGLTFALASPAQR